MRYQVVPFAAAVANDQDATRIAAKLEALIQTQANAGWEYVGVHQLQTFKAGTNGCFGFFAKHPETITSEFVVFKQ